uniref:Sulfhydryl oxidase n=1 Tax=Dermatophagoides pteronyssinus TaxID=6956 RepID=A0A6P6Y5L0_DERPT|nr:sulfhydryl oxidase 2-like [Dermatophagoides pteronyssinus]
MMDYRPVQWIIVVIIVVSIFFLQSIQTQSNNNLYDNQLDDDDSIVSLTDKTFFQQIQTYNKDRLIIINYYKHWSPECQRFSKIFRNFSRSIRSWQKQQKLVKLFAVDCAENLVCHQVLQQQQPSNDDVANDDNGTMLIDFPIIQFIGPTGIDNVGGSYSTKDFDRYSKQINQPDTIDTIDNLQKQTIKSIVSNHFLANYYSLIPIKVKNIDEICLILKQDNHHDGDHQSINFERELYAIIESNNAEIEFGARIMIDMINYQKFIHIKRFVGDQQLIESLSMISYPIRLPLILEIESSSSSSKCKYRTIGSRKNSKILLYEFQQSIRDRYGPMFDSDSITINDHRDLTIKNQTNSSMIYGDEHKVIPYNLSYVDLHNALRYSLIYEIVNGRRRFNGRQLQVIKQLFQTILQYFPFDNENVRRLFKRMTGWFVNKNGDRLDVSKYLAAIRTADGFLKPLESWRHCNGSLPIYRGYPCGLWVLFHAMTVQEFNLTRMAILNREKDLLSTSTTKKTKQSKTLSLEPKVLPVMRNYIETFFTCSECRHYFLNVSSNLREQLPYLNSSVIWLWTVHNQMNSKLSHNGDPYKYEDPYYPKYQFPTKEICPKCLNNYGQYDERNVIDFLDYYYSKQTMRANSSVNNNNNNNHRHYVMIIMMMIIIINIWL